MRRILVAFGFSRDREIVEPNTQFLRECQFLHIYNTLTRTKEEVRSSGELKAFVCGPTVQDNVHLGHAKTYIAFDVLARWLLKSGQKVFLLMNITDVDDKIFDRAKKENLPYMEIADKFYREFLEDLEALNIVTVSKFARVSKYVEDSALLVKQLLDSGTAYRLHDNVYFDTSKAHDFGKLSHQSELDLRLKQIDAAPGKKNAVDFLLWRAVPESSDGIWKTTVGSGRPGWHIEDSAVAFSNFGTPYDIHGGATELVFPHHEAELAQDEAISGIVPFVKIWMHTGLLRKGHEKMSKSLGNVITIREALKQSSADEIRFYFLSHHYKEEFQYDSESFNSSKKKFKIILDAARVLPKRNTATEKLTTEPLLKVWTEFASAMDDDLDTGKALSILLRIIEHAGNQSENKEELGILFWNMIEALGFRIF